MSKNKKSGKWWNFLSWSRKKKIIFVLVGLPILVGFGYWVYTGCHKSLGEVAEDMVAGVKSAWRKVWNAGKDVTKGAKKGLSS